MTMQRTKIGAFISSIVLLLVIVTCVPTIRGAIAQAFTGVHYFNNDVNADNIGNNDWNFGPDRKEAADKAVSAGTSNVTDYIATKSGEGDFFASIEQDPALCAAIALHLDESVELPEKILVDEQNELIGQRADKAHLHFLADKAYWDRAVQLIKEYTSHAGISVEHISDYTSAMYMWHNGLDGNKPSVIVRNTTNAGGDVLIFDFGKPGIVKFRLQCGYQPVDVPYWPTPDYPPVPDNPVPDNPEPDQPEPDEPHLDPKDPNAGPQGQVPNNPDFGGGQNHNNNEELTPEPTSPSEYVAPTAPAEEHHENSNPQPSNPGNNHGNGTTETHGGQDYEVTAGDGQTHPDLAGVVDDHHNEGTVETPVAGDGQNQGDIVAPE